MANPNSSYPTSNTAMAAYLLTEGFTHTKTTSNPRQLRTNGFDAVFHFQDDPHILDCVRLWQTCQATGNLSVFFDNYRFFVREAKKAVGVASL